MESASTDSTPAMSLRLRNHLFFSSSIFLTIRESVQLRSAQAVAALLARRLVAAGVRPRLAVAALEAALLARRLDVVGVADRELTGSGPVSGLSQTAVAATSGAAVSGGTGAASLARMW